jgi:uridylate kinase
MEPDYLQPRLFDIDMDESKFSEFKRVLLKLSGEALAGELGYGVDENVAKRIAKEIIEAKNDLLVQIAIVVGGGNIWRGAQHPNMDRTTADYNGMLATVMNAKVMKSMLEDLGQETRVMSAIEINTVAEPYIQGRAIQHLEKGRVVILAGGTGNPFFTTDTAAVLRATELRADAVLMAKNGVDGVYDSDPKTNPNAVRFSELEHSQLNEMKLKVMDITATALAEDNEMPIIVFDGLKRGGLEEILLNPSSGTVIK